MKSKATAATSKKKCCKKTKTKSDFFLDEATEDDDAEEEEEEELGDDNDDDDDDFTDSSEEEEEEEEEEEMRGRKRRRASGGDVEEELIADCENDGSCGSDGICNDHTYSSCQKITGQPKRKKRRRCTYNLLYAVSVSGQQKQIKNCLPAAVSILSNSKKLFLGHLNVMLKCLDPALAEICYIDTDSCMWSLTFKNLEDCILPEMRDFFYAQNILADEQGTASCHGKMKLEGTFKAGHFKTIKIYRLFSDNDNTAAAAAADPSSAVYTRCKGVNRWLAGKLSDSAFDSDNLDKITIHRSALRPSRTGEMLIVHESRSLAAPFNLKRHVTRDGYHTLPISFVPDC